jgi:hypothetical protein
MKLTQTILGFSLLLSSGLLSAETASHPPTAVTGPSNDQCQSEVLKFERVIGFIRESQGNRAAAEVKEKMLPAKTETDILNREGYCGLAKYLRDKKLVS